MKKNYLLKSLFLLFAFVFSANTIAQNVNVIEDLYSESGSGTLYRNTTYTVNTIDINDLAAYTVEADIEFLNIHYNDGINGDAKYDLFGVAGKTLQAIFGGDNDQNQVVDITQLRNDWWEWFRVEDGRPTVVNCSIIARHAYLPAETVEVTTGLLNDSADGTQYNTTAYYVKGIATMDDLDLITVGVSVDFLNIYLKNTTGSEDPFTRVTLETGVAGETLKTILIANGIAISDLYWDYVEWFKKDSNPTLVRLNIKAVELLETVKVEVYPDLFADGQHDKYATTAYKVHSTAVLADLTATVIPASVDFVNIYIPGFLGIGSETLHIDISAEITLEQIFIDEGLMNGGADLKDNYYSWFEKENDNGSFSPTLLNINAKASTIIGTVPQVTKTTDIFSSGTFEYENIAYFVNSNATVPTLESYPLTGDQGVNIYYIDSNGDNASLDIQTSVVGKTLNDVLVENGIAITDLRLDYIEWFRDANGFPKLVNLNIKEKIELPDEPRIIETNDLFWTSGATDYEYTSYLVKASATEADLDTKILPSDVQFINVYTVLIDGNGDPIRYTLHGVANKTLKVALTAAGNDEGITVLLADLRLDYVEWFKDINDQFTLINMNIKSGKDITLGLDDDYLTAITSVYPNPVNDVLHITIQDRTSFDFSVYSMKGNLIFKGSSKTNSVDIDVSPLSQGVYILKIESEGASFASKFIMQ